ncbi:hypothetical protein GOHSU_18_01350 [Gordonia hirsuta DSM 44140 = NBRC 16056]|uniref:HNH nuclease domain-containing protein n=1 Tax=Gordonia hirsuta DSM 44140 = NBRC 16056 TaxID=1121927 RepID=L7L8A6_9ACTN|nr:HNH endonuclease signature motif containing protein [Gordonia hirsuta]GAC57380.1 hypothetical protein GOHSU_18_01350 [Gordonia hirsuta DSM 44140 = NBRC 16056]
MLTEQVVEFADRLADELTAHTGCDDDVAGGGGGDPGTLLEFLQGAAAVTDEREVLGLLAGLNRLRNTVDHALARVTATAERIAIPARKRVRSGGALLVELGMAPAVAYRTARLGAALEQVPAVTRGMRDGSVSAEFGDAVVRGLGFVGNRVALDHDARTQVTTSLMVQVNPAKVEAKAREWAIRLAPAEPEAGGVPVAEDSALNEVSLVQDDDGRVRVSMDLDVVAGEELSVALEPLTRPTPEPDGSSDRRSAGRRRADAFRQVISTYLSGSQRPESGGVLPHVTLIVPAGLTVAGRPVDSAGEPGAAMASGQATVLPLPATAWEQQVPRAPSLSFTGPVTPATAGLVMCEASVCVALVDGEGVPLNMGREARLMTPEIRKALHVRDRGCAMCGAPVTRCDAHHMHEWQHGGPTSLANGVLLCRLHHGWIHQLGWEVFLGDDGHPWFLPPVDPEHPHRSREPIQSYARRTMNLANLPGAA